MTRLIAGGLMILAASTASAQNWQPLRYEGLTSSAAMINSGTVISDIDVEHGNTGVNTILSATTAVSASLQYRIGNMVVASETLAVGPLPISRTAFPPQFFDNIKVSPTTPPAGSLTLHVNVNQAN